MRIRTVVAVLVICVVGGALAGVGIREWGGDSATASPDATPPTAPTSAGELEITPGAVGPVRAGMSKASAVASGFFDADVAPPVEGCPVLELAWKKPFDEALDVMTLGNGQITSIGVRAKGPVTGEGLGIGSTLAEVERVLTETEVEEAGYGQSGLYLYDPEEGGWIGFLFDADVKSVKPTSTVSFVEVTRGAKPDLMRDGC